MVEELTEKRPVTQARPALRLYFDLPGVEHIDWGPRYTRVQFGSTINSGYIAKFNLHDPHFNTFNKLIESGYFKVARNKPVKARFQILASKDGGEFPRTATSEQIGYMSEVKGSGEAADVGNLEFIIIDPASYLLNNGSGSGKAYTGKISNIIKQVVSEYAKELKLDISETIDSDKAKHWMMRQDPQSFITSLLEWSSPLTQSKTQWIVSSNGLDLQIKAQADIKSKQRAYYTFYEPASPSRDTILTWDLITDNSLSLTNTRIISQGLSAVSGAYLDPITDQEKDAIVIKDSTTGKKTIANTSDENSFAKANEQIIGASSIASIPEYYSAGDLGLNYDNYIDGRARDLWLGLTRNLVRCRFRVLGHGEWSDGFGLGIDTIKIMWMSAPKNLDEPAREWFLSGNWLVYGFEHDVTPHGWFTDIYAARFDFDASGTKVPS